MAKITVKSIGTKYRAELRTTGDAPRAIELAWGATAQEAHSNLVNEVLVSALLVAERCEEQARELREAHRVLSQEQPKP